MVSSTPPALQVHTDSTVLGFSALPLLLLERALTALSSAVPAHIIAAIRGNMSFDFSTLLPKSRLSAHTQTKTVVWTENGTLALYEASRSDDSTITESGWHSVAPIVLKLMTELCTPARATTTKTHHTNVATVSKSHGWPVAWEYDILQCERAYANLLHDIGHLDWNVVTSIITRPSFQLSLKHASESPLPAASSGQPCKKLRVPSSTGTHCFHCGVAGHFPLACSATSTTAHKPVATVSSNGQGGTTLADASSKAYCFNWARRSACTFGDGCRNKHACSICHLADHSATGCRHAASN